MKQNSKPKPTFLTPTTQILTVKGRLLYHESAQAWNTIKIKKEIFHLFPQLKDKRSNFNYMMIVPRTNDQFKEQLEELKKDSSKVPILLFFEKDDLQKLEEKKE